MDYHHETTKPAIDYRIEDLEERLEFLMNKFNSTGEDQDECEEIKLKLSELYSERAIQLYS